MAKKSTKTKSKTIAKKETSCISTFCHPSTWLIALLAVALLVIVGVSAYTVKELTAKNAMETAKLEVFDHLAESYIRDMEFTADFDKPTVKQITGYGISDEDGVFYVTFDFFTIDENHTPTTTEPRHAIIYFQKDNERGTYGHAFSYHDDDYHPGGTYVKLTQH